MMLNGSKNQKYRSIIGLMLLLCGMIWLFSCIGKSSASPSMHWFVKEGRAVDVMDTNGAWMNGDTSLIASGKQNLLHAGQCVGSGDFEIVAQLRIDDLSQDNASLMLDAAGPTETGELIFSRAGQIVVRGFFFGDRTQKVRPAAGLIGSGSWFDLRIERQGDIVNFHIADTLVWSMHYEQERPFGKLTLKPGQARLSVRSFGVKGKTSPLDEWIPRLERHYPIAGEEHTEVFSRGDAGEYHTYRIPTVVRTTQGTLLAIAEGRKNSAADHGNVDIVLRRSKDNGRSWQPLQLIYEEGGQAKVTIGNPVPVVDQQTGHIWLFFCRDNKHIFLTRSEDDGLSWEKPVDMTSTLKKADWGSWYATGPCHGIQLANGRLVIPANHGLTDKKGTQPHMIISDDHGASWHIGGMPDANANENTITAINDTLLYVSMRSSGHNNQRPYCREVAWSTDGGTSFGAVAHDCDLPDSICQGSLLTFHTDDGASILLFSNPASQRRERLTVRASRDGGKTWDAGRLVYGGSAAYSDLVQIDDETVGLLFERDLYHSITWTTLNIKEL